MTFDTVLIANRGEIALRIIEACRELGLRSIAVYSQADADMPYLALADESICIGPADPRKSYLNIAAIISTAELAQAGAIHPGYGFLAESPQFVEICEDHDLAFIGPSRGTMERVGNKLAARTAVAEAGVPVLPGEPVPLDANGLHEAAERVGYPLLVKSVFGGGGRGMRRVSAPGELEEKASAAAKEAEAADGDGSLYLEKAVEHSRHLEVQILGDARGDVIHFGERECSIQRRHQKLIEETPAPNLDEHIRHRLYEAALVTARAVDYRNAGTVEFLLAEDQFYFIEMNARIQVEHSVSEVVSGVNLIKEQIRIAAGEPLSLRQPAVKLRGHAIECRINAEDPKRGFAPSCGILGIKQLPGGHGVRLDSAIFQGMNVQPHYDSLLAKLITWGRNRKEARVRMSTALERFSVTGIETTRDLVRAIIERPEFRDGDYTTEFLEQLLSG